MNNFVNCWILIDVRSWIKLIKTMFVLLKIGRKRWSTRFVDYYCRKFYVNNPRTLVGMRAMVGLKTDGSDSDMLDLANDINYIRNLDGVLDASMDYRS